MKKIISIVLSLALMAITTAPAHALTYDLGLTSSDIRFSQPMDKMVAGTPVRIYATIHNFGDEDVLASVIFYSGSTLITETQPVSVTSSGFADEVFIDWTVPAGQFNLVVEIAGTDPGDQNLINNKAITSIIVPLEDSDGDGIPDVDDPDDDNDGVLDVDEGKQGTNPFNPDSDNDGVNDKNDAFPTDNSKSEPDPEPEPEPDPDPDPDPESEDEPQDNDDQDAEDEQGDADDEDGDEDEDNDDKDSEGGDEDDEATILEAKSKLNLLAEDFFNTANISIKQHGWRTYEFDFVTDADGLETDLLEFTWDYGDGSTSVKNESHTFPGAGTYHVKVSVDGPFGNKITDVKTISVGFMSMANYWLWIILGIVISVIGGFVFWIFKKKNKKKKEKE